MDITKLEKWNFERNKEAANYLLGLVLEGKKRATSSSLWGYEIEGCPIPRVGDRSVITYWDGTPGCIIETTNVRIIPYSEMTYDIAKLEGEDDNLESWKETHKHFFTEEGKELGYVFSENMPVVFEEFEVIERIMNAKLVGFFSGFPTRHFTDRIADVLREALKIRDSLVFISCQPDNYTQNDEDSDGMHYMFVEKNMPFAKHSVIDNRTSAADAVSLIREASCIFLMGGNATLQYALMQDKRILDEIRRSSAVILGVSAGAMNMGKHTVDVYESIMPYEGLGFADITVKAHYPIDDEQLMQSIKQVSMELPVCLMTDESAIFIKEESIMQIGQIYRMVKGAITPLTKEQLEGMRDLK